MRELCENLRELFSQLSEIQLKWYFSQLKKMIKMTSRLITKIAKMVTVDYCRLTFVENPDGFLLHEDVCCLLRQEQNIEVVKGSQLALRLHYELHFKQSIDGKYVYLCDDADSLLPDMRQEGVKLTFSISDVFPLFADKSLVRRQSVEVLELL
jgi:hypothetical protein